MLAHVRRDCSRLDLTGTGNSPPHQCSHTYTVYCAEAWPRSVFSLWWCTTVRSIASRNVWCCPKEKMRCGFNTNFGWKKFCYKCGAARPPAPDAASRGAWGAWANGPLKQVSEQLEPSLLAAFVRMSEDFDACKGQLAPR